MLGIIGTSWQTQVAATQRDRAENRFNQVRVLANTFMGEFHDKIQELDGSIPARKLLVQSALEYLDDLAEEAGDNVELIRELAQGYDRVGEILGGIRNPSLGDTAGALQHYRTALELRQAAANAEPGNLDIQGDISKSHIVIGDALRHSGDSSAALDEYRISLTIRETLADKSPSFELRRGVVHSLDALGDALLAMGRIAEARAYYDRSLAIRQALAADHPEDVRVIRAVSVAHISLGRAFQATAT